MTDSELIEHLHARGWRTETIDVPMIREACKALQEASATGAGPVAWRYKDSRGHWRYRGYKANFDVEYSILKPEPLYATPTTSTTGKDLTDGAVFHLASRIANLINRHDGKADTLMPELRALVLAVTGKVDASRVRDEAWQPIETAPRDCTNFLAYRRGQIATASCLVRDDGEMWSFGNQSWHRDVCPDLVPSHWMPLPAPPV